MNLLTILPIVLLISPFILAQDPPQCASCCPPDPAPDTVACDTLDSHLDMINEAIEESKCDDTFGPESDDVCHAITMKAIPPCMLIEGASEQAKCLAKAAEDIEEELGLSEEAGTEVVTNCKCDAFKKIRKALSSVRDMMCPPSDDRSGRTYSNFGANTLWFQYILCQQESIPSLACWLFTSGWNQAEFGQYYFYENLLDSDNVAGLGLDGDLLPLLVLSGGLGGGAYSGPSYGGHPVYRREVIEDEGCPAGHVETADGCALDRKRRATTTCHPDDVNCPARKRRGATATPCHPDDKDCLSARKRRGVTTPCHPDDKDCHSARKRRGVTTPCHPDNKVCLSARKRRSATTPCHPDDKDCLSARKRRGVTTPCRPDDKDCLSTRNRRSATTPCHPNDKDCLSARNRRSATTPCHPDDKDCLSARNRRSATTPCHLDDKDCLSARNYRSVTTPCHQDDKDCLFARNRRSATTPCHPDDQDCLSARNRRSVTTPCQPDDKDCLSARKRRGATATTCHPDERDSNGSCM